MYLFCTFDYEKIFKIKPAYFYVMYKNLPVEGMLALLTKLILNELDLFFCFLYWS